MKCCTPVITSNTSSLPEVVGDAGILINPTNSDDLSQAMFDVYRNTELRNTLAKKASDRAVIFSWGKTVRETVELYRLVI
jgi:glycosyltransferase involved in cell wall biosynthesis